MEDLTEMYRHSGDGNPIRVIEDVYGNWVPRMPGYATLDGLPIEEWNNNRSETYPTLVTK